MEQVQMGVGVEAIGGFVAVIIAAALWLRKLKPSFAVDDKLAAVAAADTGIIHRLEAESQRLAAQNDKLASSVNKLQDEVSKLGGENAALRMEVQQLVRENEALRREIRELMDIGRSK